MQMQSKNPQVYSSQGQSLTLAVQLGCGGEGTVYEVNGRPQQVAKVYHRGVDADKSAKLRVMAAIATGELLNLAAWPVDTLHDRPSGQMIGFLMLRVAGHKEIHRVYNPKDRQVEFVKADWRFLIHTAANLAR